VQNVEFVGLDEFLSRRSLVKFRNVWNAAEPSGLDHQIESVAQYRRFSIDRCVGSTLALSGEHESLDAVRRDIDGAVSLVYRDAVFRRCLAVPEESPQLSDVNFNSLERAITLESVDQIPSNEFLCSICTMTDRVARFDCRRGRGVCSALSDTMRETRLTI
jgi:hypothetical protein